jgi:hypothetical protein
MQNLHGLIFLVKPVQTVGGTPHSSSQLSRYDLLKDDHVILPHCMGQAHLEYLLKIKLVMCG